MHHVGGVGEDADGHGHGVNGHGQAAVVDIAVPEAGRPAALYMDHVAVVVAAVVVVVVVVVLTKADMIFVEFVSQNCVFGVFLRKQ